MDFVLIQGGGDLATGIAMRLRRAGFHPLITELPQPLAVRRAVSFSEAVYAGAHHVEDLTARRVATLTEIEISSQRGEIPVLVDPQLIIVSSQLLAADQPGGKTKNRLSAQIDARLLKTEQPVTRLGKFPFKIGLGPGFTAGVNCHAALETNRGHLLGRVLWQGATSADTGQPEGDPRRVLRAPADGELIGYAQIGETVTAGQLLARVGGEPVFSPFSGVLRGLVRPGLRVMRGVKIGDVDARGIRDYCFLVSDKALAIGGAALEAVMTYGLRP